MGEKKIEENKKRLKQKGQLWNTMTSARHFDN